MAHVTVDSIEIVYEDAGEGEPALLFLPGWSASRAAFEPLRLELTRRRRTIALDWRDHGASGPAPEVFGNAALVEDALAVIEASGVDRVVPVTQAHAGWVAIELRRRLGDRIAKAVFLSWLVTELPPPFRAALEASRDPDRWQSTREAIFDVWLAGLEDPGLVGFVREDMGSYGFESWARGCGAVLEAYGAEGSPLQALAAIDPPMPVVHFYAQPSAPEFLATQEAFAAEHPWFHVQRLEARSFFPAFEVAPAMVDAIERFAGA